MLKNETTSTYIVLIMAKKVVEEGFSRCSSACVQKSLVREQKKTKKRGRTRIRTGVVRIKTESDNHYTIQPSTFALLMSVQYTLNTYKLQGEERYCRGWKRHRFAS